MEEPRRTSMLDFVRSLKRSNICRLLYCAEINSPMEDVLKAFAICAKGIAPEAITGLLLVYPQYILHSIEATEEEIFQLCLSFFNKYPNYLGNTKCFPMQVEVKSRFFDKWYSRKAVDRISKTDGHEIGVEDSFENVTAVYRKIIFDLYEFYQELRMLNNENHSLFVEKLESIHEVGHNLLPDKTTVDFILGSRWGERLSDLVDGFCNPEKCTEDEILWPFPKVILPLVDFNEIDATKNELKKKDSKFAI